MEEIVLFGKQRHFFGGIAPSNMLEFSGKFKSDISKYVITAKLPKDTIIDGQMVCCVDGATIRKSYEDYPKNEFEGELVVDIKEDCEIMVDVNDSEGTAYFSAFPYSKQGVFNRNKFNRMTPIKYGYLFGYDLDTTEKDPDERVTYPDEVENRNYTHAKMNFSTGLFDYGDWPSTPGEKFMPRPCMLKFDGTVDYFLDPNDYTKKEDGVNASDVTNASYPGNAMMQWPKIYTKRWEENGIYHFRCSDTKIDDDWDCWCNYDKNDNEIPFFYTAIYQGSYVYGTSNRFRSLSGLKPSLLDYNIKMLRQYAKPNGDDWDISVLSDRLLINDLLTMLAKTTDLQGAFGAGVYSNGTLSKSGVLDAKGLFYGTLSSSPIKIFGMENWWGNAIQFILGMVAVSGNIKFKFTRGTIDGSTGADYDLTSSLSGYIEGLVPSVSSTTSGYIKGCMTTKFGRIPYMLGGSATEYECDAITFSNSSTGRVTTVGSVPASSYPNGGGPFSLATTMNYAEGDEYTTVSLSCKPSAT